MKKEKEKTTEKVEKKEKTVTTQKPKSMIIKIEDLVPFKDHPYKVIENESMTELIESIKENGILNPLIVRPLDGEENKYEIISGHRRFFAAQKLGMIKIPCTVHYIDRDAATVIMVDSNCQRTELLPSEKAWTYKMKMDAQNRQGQRTDLTSCPPGTKSEDEQPAEESKRQIYRYIRLTYLVPELLQYVDEGKIAMRPAVEMSYLDEEIQRDIVDCIDDSEIFPSHAQARRIRQQAESGGISYEDIVTIINEQKPNQIEKIKIPYEELNKRIGKNLTDSAYIDYIFQAIDFYKKHIRAKQEPER